MSEPHGSQGLYLRTTFGRTGTIMFGAAALLLAAGCAMEGRAAAGPSGAAISEPSGSEFMLIQNTKTKKKKRVYRNRQALPQQCLQWCPRDTNPCDPPDFKIADGRCDWRDEFW